MHRSLFPGGKTGTCRRPGSPGRREGTRSPSPRSSIAPETERPEGPGHAPQLEQRIDGTVRETGKYIQPAQRGNMLYIPPGVPVALVADVSVPVIVTE